MSNAQAFAEAQKGGVQTTHATRLHVHSPRGDMKNRHA